jgi:type I restriction enzyme M protein
MTEAQKQRLEQQLWKIANELRGKMGADEFRDYILGFIFYKYLSEKQHLYANQLLETESVKDYAQVTDPDDIDAIHEESLLKLGYFLRPDELFSAITAKGNANVEEVSATSFRCCATCRPPDHKIRRNSAKRSSASSIAKRSCAARKS